MSGVGEERDFSAIDALIASTGASQLSDDQIVSLKALAHQCPAQTSLDEEPIRTIHHLSATGGTLFTKCIASMPNVVVLNEIDPFSLMQAPKGKPPFTPTDLIALVRQGDPYLASRSVIAESFLETIKALRRNCWQTGRILVLRDHSHSQFLYGEFDPSLPTLRDVLAQRFPVLSVITTREPNDAFASMKREGWHNHFNPSTFEEYRRRCAMFECGFQSVPKFAYEDLTAKPKEVMRALCNALKLEYHDIFEDTFSAHLFSGDSGRGGRVIINRASI